MSRRKNGTNKLKLEKLNAIQVIDKKMKRRKVREDEEQMAKFLGQRNTLRAQLKGS